MQTTEKIPRADRADGARDFRSRLDPAAVQRARPPGARPGSARPVAPADPAQRNHARLFHAAGRDLIGRGRGTVSRRARPGSEGGRGRSTISARTIRVKAAMLHARPRRTSCSGGYRINVIPSEAKATLDVRMLPDDDLDALLASMRQVVNDPAVSVEWAPAHTRPPGGDTPRHRGLQGDRGGAHEELRDDDAADDEHWRDGHGVSARQRACSATASGRPSTWRMGRRASAPTATRSASSRASCTVSSVSTGTSSTILARTR